MDIQNDYLAGLRRLTRSCHTKALKMSTLDKLPNDLHARRRRRRRRSPHHSRLFCDAERAAIAHNIYFIYFKLAHIPCVRLPPPIWGKNKKERFVSL